MRRALAAALAAALAGAASAAEYDRGDWRFELGGDLRTLGVFTRITRSDTLFDDGRLYRSDAGLLLERVRLNGQAVWNDRWFAQLTYDLEGRTGSFLDTVAWEVADALDEQTWIDLDRTLSSRDDTDLRHLVYRAFVRYETDRVEIALGRQRIPLGRARLWNPIDLFNPIPPLAIEGDQRIGQDAVRARVRLLEGFWAGAIWSPQDDPDEHRGALRFEWSRTAFDAALLAGRFGRDWVFGADGAANLGGAAGRFEATYSRLETGPRIWQVVAGVDYTFPLGAGLYALVEHFYNENLVEQGEIARSALAIPREELVAALAEGQKPLLDRLASRVRHQTGFEFGYDLTPLLRGDFLAIWDWRGASAALVPSLTWSVRSNVSLSVGAQLFVGSDGDSEFGDASELGFARFDYYF